MLLEAVVVEVSRSAAAGSILILLLLAEVVLVLLVVLLLLLLTTAMVPLLSCLMASAAKNGAVAIESLPFMRSLIVVMSGAAKIMTVARLKPRRFTKKKAIS